MAKPDENREHVAMAAQNNAGLAAAPFKVDPATGRLLVAFVGVSDSVPVLNTSKVDGNREHAALAYNGTDEVPLLVDNRNGYLWVDNA